MVPYRATSYKTSPVSKKHFTGPHQCPPPPNNLTIPNTKPLHELVEPLRLIKNPDELDAIKTACSISAACHNHILSNRKHYTNERHIEGAFLEKMYHLGVRSSAYPAIVATGSNACILHYTRNDQGINPNDILLIDAGCEYKQYASDITRCFPAKKQFSKQQQAVYEAVLDTQQFVLDQIKPGVTLSQLNIATQKRVSLHLSDLTIINESAQVIYEHKLFQKYFPHGVGHTLGLDVHDIPTKKEQPLTAGMVITIEPGIYIQSHSSFNDIGIRIEDVIHITNNSYENLSQGALKTVSDIEHNY